MNVDFAFRRRPLVNVVHRVAGGYAVEAPHTNLDRMLGEELEHEGTQNRRALFLEGAVWMGYRGGLLPCVSTAR